MKIYILRVEQQSPRIDTVIFSSKVRQECIDFFKKSEHEECYLEEWSGTVVLVRNILIK